MSLVLSLFRRYIPTPVVHGSKIQRGALLRFGQVSGWDLSGLGVDLYPIYSLQARASMPSTRSRIRGGRTSSINYWTQPRVGFTGSAMGKHTTKRQGREIVGGFVASRGSTCGSEIVTAL